jgi:hypothetical protein
MEKIKLAWCAAQGSSKNNFAIVTFLWLVFMVTYYIQYFTAVHQALSGSTGMDPATLDNRIMGMLYIIYLCGV